ncbi:MAG: C25 family cysteine peptidase [bacterium]|nr:C25 family cysteine peptidase [bacterium]
MNIRAAFRISLLGVLLCFATAGAEWIATDSAIPSTPTVALVSHTPSATVLDITVPGFYSEEVREAGTLYQQLSFGDFAMTQEVGKPQLPIVTKLIGIPDRSDLRVSVEVLATKTLTGFHVWPAQEPLKDGEAAPPFVINSNFYTQNVNYPGESAVVDLPQIWRDVRLTRLEVRPMTYNPATNQLTVATKIRVRVEYFGYNPVHEFTQHRAPINLEFQNLYRSAVVNFDQMGLPLNNGMTDDPGTKYLIVTTTPALPYVTAFANFRNAQGYETEVRALGTGFSTAEEIKAYITTLYNQFGLEYVLIVGDAYYSGGPGAVDVPMYYWVDSYSDSWYTMMDGANDYLADLAIGRIIYDTPAELTLQMNKTMSYLTAPEVSNWAAHTLLVAHQEEYPQKYTLCKEQIRTFNYAIQNPIFGTAYGGAGATNADVVNYLNTNSSGILNYRGHGSATEWWQWGPSGSFTATNIAQLTNTNRLFVHFDVCCDNMDFPGYNGNCLAESFMKSPVAAVAIHSAIIPSYTIPNHDYDKEFYKAIYNNGINHIGYASNYANITVYQLHGTLGESNIRTYLWLGDACIDTWTNTMQTLTVTHPTAMLIGTSTLTVSTGFQGALVCAQNAEVYASGVTGASGSITLQFTPGPQIPGLLKISVSAHNYLTYQQDISIIPPSGPYVVFNDCDINDSQVGNNNGQWDFGETTDLSIELKNVGVQPAPAVNATISTADPLITVIDGTQAYGNINANDSVRVADGFRVQAAVAAPDQHAVTFTLTATSGTSSWQSPFSLLVNAPVVAFDTLRILDPAPGNNNGALDPGETATFQIALENTGHSIAQGTSAAMTSNDPLVTITGSPATYGDINPGASVQRNYTVAAASNVPSGTLVRFTMNITATGGYTTTSIFNLIVGDVRNMPSGPDSYGYLAWDNNDGGQSHPYSWVEIAPQHGGSGTVLALTSDDQTVQATLPFTFRYYGNNFTNISVCTNGWLAMGTTTSTDYSASAIPNADGPPNMVAGFWHDLNAGAGGTQICTWFSNQQHLFVVEWDSSTHYGVATSRETFQIILYDPAYYPTSTSDGPILIQHKRVSDIVTGTFGIENQTQTVGIQYGFNNSWETHAWPVQAGRTVTYTTPAAGTSNWDVSTSPVSPPVVIPANGGSFPYNCNVHNLGTTPGTVSLWNKVRDQANIYTQVFGPITRTLPGGANPSRVFTQTIAGSVSSGTLYFISYVGTYPSTIADSSFFTITKSTVADGNPWISESYVTGDLFYEFATADEVEVPQVFSLGQNYPNPFNPLTTISFGLPEAAQVTLTIFDVMGREVATLVNGMRDAGIHNVTFDATGLASGIYLYRIEAGSFTAIHKMVLMK